MKRTTVFLDEGSERALRAIASREKVPVAVLLREAIERLLASRRRRSAADLAFLAAGRSGRSDIAERHEDLLWAPADPAPRAAAKRSRTR